MPSESELVERYGIADGTIRKAMVEVRASGVETLQARPAAKAEASEFALSLGAPAVHLLRSSVTQAGRVVEVCDALMAADQFAFEYRTPTKN